MSSLLPLLIFLVDMSAKDLAPEAVELDLEQLAGFYEQPASRCQPTSTHSVGTCSASATDRLVIQPLSDTHARVAVHSHQDSDHECHVDGVASLTPVGLSYCLEYEPGTCLVLTQDADHIRLKVTIEGDFYVPFCGSRATLDGLLIDKRARLSRGRCAGDGARP
jgi:hypothetical protein